MKNYYLAVDIGASSGRHMLSWVEDGRICLKEIYRFDNGQKMKNGHLCWDMDALFRNVVDGLKACHEQGITPVSVGIDTWAVDFVLLDEEDRVLGDTVGYRDSRTTGMDEEVYKIIPEADLYARTGIQKQIFNTIYQLMAVKQEHPEQLEEARSFLLIPDYLNFLLTGVKKTEYTNATTTQLLNPKTKDWDKDLMQMLGYPTRIFGPVTMPGTTVGALKSEIADQVGFTTTVIQAASHDTASAVMAVPALEEHFVYISSGTWSLMGTEILEAICTSESHAANFTNEGGYEYRYRFLKNIMGLWMIQSVRHELDDQYSFAQLCEMAAENDSFPSRVDVNDDVFLAPENMTKAIQAYCVNSGQKMPETPGELSAVIYHSLADCYGETAREIEFLTGRTYDSIHVVGGGANAAYLNQLTADASGKTVYAGPTEATALGNISAQLLKAGEYKSLAETRKAIFDSFEIKCYKPQS